MNYRPLAVTKYFPALLLSIAAVLSNTAMADMRLDENASKLSFVTIKADNVAEVHSFDSISGSVSDSGRITLSIDLASVNTAIPIRNERMQTLLFETELFPRATITGQVAMNEINSMVVGQSKNLNLDFNVNLHGESAQVSAQLTVIKLTDGVHVSTLAPIIVQANAFSLATGVERLREVAGLTRISEAVPVSISAVFR